MIIPLHQIHHLIQTLQPNEQKACKVLLQLHPSPQILSLFEGLQKAANPNKVVPPSDLQNDDAKNYQQMVNDILHITLQILNFNSAPQRKANEITKIIVSIRTLYLQKQYPLCVTLLKNARKMALKYEMFEPLQVLITWEKLLARTNLYHRSLREINREEIELIEKISNLYAYRTLNLKAYEMDGQYIPRGAKVKKLTYLLKDPLLQNPKKALSSSAKLLFNAIHASIHRNREDYETTFFHYEQMVEIYRNQPSHINKDCFPYLATINNYAHIALYLKKHDKVVDVAQELKKMPAKYEFVEKESLEIELLLRAAYLELQVYRDTLDLDKTTATINSIKHHLQNSTGQTRVLYKAANAAEIAEILFIQEQFEQALTYLSILFSYDQFVDLQLTGRFLEILIYIEQKNTPKLKDCIAFTKEYMQKNKILSRYENLFIEMALNLEQDYPKDQEKAIFKEFIQLFEAINPLINADSYFDIISWLKSKYQENSFRSVLQEKHWIKN